MNLTKENVAILRTPFSKVWNAIGPDILEGEPDINSRGIIEACWDCDRLTEYTIDASLGITAETLVKELINVNGYHQTAAFLATEFKFA